MKKKLFLLMLALAMVLALAGCKKDDAKEDSKTEQSSSEEATSTEAAETKDVTGMQNTGKMYYTMPEGWEESENQDGSSLYKYENGSSMASASIGFQEEGKYKAEDMINAYENSIKQNIGQWDEKTEEQIGSYKWNHYEFKDGTVQDGIYAQIYLYSDGKQTLYFEFAATSDVDMTETIPSVLESVVVQ